MDVSSLLNSLCQFVLRCVAPSSLTLQCRYSINKSNENQLLHTGRTYNFCRAQGDEDQYKDEETELDRLTDLFEKESCGRQKLNRFIRLSKDVDYSHVQRPNTISTFGQGQVQEEDHDETCMGRCVNHSISSRNGDVKLPLAHKMRVPLPRHVFQKRVLVETDFIRRIQPRVLLAGVLEIAHPQDNIRS